MYIYVNTYIYMYGCAKSVPRIRLRKHMCLSDTCACRASPFPQNQHACCVCACMHSLNTAVLAPASTAGVAGRTRRRRRPAAQSRGRWRMGVSPGG